MSRLSVFFKHPAVLLLLGFVSTSVVGTMLTETWKSREWRNQQGYLFAQRALEKRYALIDETVKAVAETNTAAEDVLASYTWNWNPGDLKQRRAKWLEGSWSWRVNSKVISQALSTYFANPRVSSRFDDIIRKRRQLGNIITNLLTNGYQSGAEAKTQMEIAQRLNNEITDDLRTCGKLMAGELK